MIREASHRRRTGVRRIGSAPVAMADPNDNMYFDKPGRYDSDVPFMNYEARLAAPCDNFEINTFGRGPGGEPLQCHWIPNQWPPVYHRLLGDLAGDPRRAADRRAVPGRSGGRAGSRRPTPAVPRRRRAGSPASSPAPGSGRHSRALVRSVVRNVAGCRRAFRCAPRPPCGWSPAPAAAALRSASARRCGCPISVGSKATRAARAALEGTAGPRTARRRSPERTAGQRNSSASVSGPSGIRSLTR